MRVDGVGAEQVAQHDIDVKRVSRLEHTNEDFLKARKKEIDDELKGKERGQPVSKKEVDEIIKKLNEVMDTFDIQARFSVHKETNQIVVKLVDIRNNKIVREIPPEKILDMVAKMIKFIGMLFDVKV